MVGRSAVALTLVVVALGSQLRGPANDFQTLKDHVVTSQTFKDKVAQSCKGQGADCASKATGAIFCQLLQRSKPDLAAANCGAKAAPKAAPKGSFAVVKAQILQSESFKHQADGMAVALGCSGVKKVGNCDKYVQEAAFCLAFADKLDKFSNMAGAKEEAAYCEHIDDKMPALAMLQKKMHPKPAFVEVNARRAPEDDLAKEMTHDLEMNFNKIAPFGKEDTAKELQDHAAKTQDTLVDAVENAEVAEIKRAVFRALTRLRAATIKEFDTIARLETQAIDAYNDAHHYRAENPLTHLHEDEAPVETDKLKSFH